MNIADITISTKSKRMSRWVTPVIMALFFMLALTISMWLPAQSRVSPAVFLQSGPVLTVNQTADVFPPDGVCELNACTLREALAAVNLGMSNEIRFAEALAGQTISLTAPLTIEQAVLIAGPAGNSLSIDGDGQHPIFLVSPADEAARIQLNDLLLQNGRNGDPDGGGAIVNRGRLSLVRVQLADNVALYDGGAIANHGGTLSVLDSAVVSNTAQRNGGAIVNYDGDVSLTNVTLSGNRAFASGGALAGPAAARYTLDSVTITRNRADSDADGIGAGGALFVAGVLQSRNAIVAGNWFQDPALSDDCAGAAPSIWTTTLGGAGCPAAGGGNLQLGSGALAGKTIDDVLDPTLADNGGATLIHALVEDSPAIDAADCSDLATDQRGAPRPDLVRGVCDMGAFELQPPPPTAFFDSASLNVAEGDGVVAATVRLSTPTSQTVQLAYAAVPGSATPGEDYEPVSATLTISSGATTGQIRLTLLDDEIDEDDETVALQLRAPINAQLGAPAAAQFTIADDDTASVTVTAPVTVTDESGAAALLTYALTSEPTADVTLAFSSDDVSEGIVSPDQITYTPLTWQTPQTVTVTGQDDDVDDDDVRYRIRTAVASSDARYAALTVDEVELINRDDDKPPLNLAVGELIGAVTEGGGAGVFAISVAGTPTATITIDMTVDDPTEIAVTPVSLSFSAGVVNEQQTVTVRGLDDEIDDDVQNVAVRFTVRSLDDRADGYSLAPLIVPNQDDDTAAVTVEPAGGRTDEAGASFAFSVTLESEPVAPVLVELTSSDQTEGSVMPQSLRFTPGDWRTAKRATVIGRDDDIADGDVLYAIRTTVLSNDAKYGGLDAADVTVINGDNDTAAVLLSTDAITTTEEGDAAVVSIGLSSRPTSAVTIAAQVLPASGRAIEVSMAPTSVTFTPEQWMAAQALTVTGMDDAVDDGDARYAIELAAQTADPVYAAIALPVIEGVNLDDDTAGVTLAPLSGTTTEGGGGFDVTAVLASQPTASVVLALTPERPGEVAAAPAELVFTPESWLTPQTVALRGVDDDIDDGDRTAPIAVTVESRDIAYADLKLDDLIVVNEDDDTAGVKLVGIANNAEIVEGGPPVSYAMQLLSEPTMPVMLEVATDGQSEVSLGGVTFDTSLTVDLSMVPTQVLQLRAVDDAVAEPLRATAVISHSIVTDDPAYADFARTTTLDVTAVDDDVVAFAAADAAAVEGTGLISFTVTMTGTANVTVTTAYATAPLPFQASAGIDYQPITGVVTFPVAGPFVQQIVVPLFDDAVPEADEAFSLELTTPTPESHAVILARAVATGTILNDDGVAVCPPDNITWHLACSLTLTPGAGQRIGAGDMTVDAVVTQSLERQGEARWYRFPVEPGSRVAVTLEDLPDNYDLALYQDISATHASSAAPQSVDDLLRLDAASSPDPSGTDELGPDRYSPDMFSPHIFSPEALAPTAFQAHIFSTDALAPGPFGTAALGPDLLEPATFSSELFSPAIYSPGDFNPALFSIERFRAEDLPPGAVAPDAFSNAQTQSLIAVSAADGVANERVVVNSWDRSGYFYLRVHGRNGAAMPQQPFRIGVSVTSGSCTDATDVLPATSLAASTAGLRTLIVVDWARMGLAPAVEDALRAKLTELADRPEVAGAVVDVGQDDRVRAAHQQADLIPDCVGAKNLVANAVEAVIGRYRAQNPLAYIVLVGSDDVIPFFRHPDRAGVAAESDFVPPVRATSAAQAALSQGYFLSQDRYGAADVILSNGHELPIPDLAVGRLAETAQEITAVVDAYLATPDGVARTPNSALVTGYDYLADGAQAVADEWAAGLGAPITTLIAPQDVSPFDPAAWTAEALRAELLTKRHDLIYLAGRFRAGSLLAADYQTGLSAAEVLRASADFANVVVFSSGSHAGYSVVDAQGVDSLSMEPDWAQAFAGRGATLIAGTGYQVGDSYAIAYGEELYQLAAGELRRSGGPVAVGEALVSAKQSYLGASAGLRAIQEKALFNVALFGLPMLKLHLPAAVDHPGDVATLNVSPTRVDRNPGQALGLHAMDLTLSPETERIDVPLHDVLSSATEQHAFWRGPHGAVVHPAEPLLPKATYGISAANTDAPIVLRGVGLRSGAYEDIADVRMLTGAAASALRGVHATFGADAFFPVRPWRVNYFSAFTDEAPRLVTLLGQYRTTEADATTGVWRRYDELTLRLFFSGNTERYASESFDAIVPAMAAPPTIVSHSATAQDGRLRFAAQATGHPAAGIQQIWITYTSTDPADAWYGRWRSLDLSQNRVNTLLWRGALDLQGVDPADVRYMIQAANGVGLVTLLTNQGAYYAPDEDPTRGAGGENRAATALQWETAPGDAAYSNLLEVGARLTSAGQALAGEEVVLIVGGQDQRAVTDRDGRVRFALRILSLPGETDMTISYAGRNSHAPVALSLPLRIVRQPTQLTIDVTQAGGDAAEFPRITALLSDSRGRPLGERSVFFLIRGGGFEVNALAVTDAQGQAPLGTAVWLALPAGAYTVEARFGQDVALDDGETVVMRDVRFNDAAAVAAVNIGEAPDGRQTWLPLIRNQ